jgi:hypothetical protein
MGTALTGLEIKDTYDGLVKTTDNGPISGTLKALSDGLGNDSTLSLSTTAASIAGTLAVTGNAAFDTNVLFVDAANNRVGIGTASPADGVLNLAAATQFGTTICHTYLTVGAAATKVTSNGSYTIGVDAADGSTERMRITSAGNVGIGTSTPDQKLNIVGSQTTAYAASSGSEVVPLGGVNMTLQNTGTGGFTSMRFVSLDGSNAIGYMGFANTTSSVGGAFVFGQRSGGGYAEQVRIQSGGGISFNGDTAAANALDDYEEGTWTMGVSFGGATSGMTFGLREGRYTKVGRQVTVSGYMNLTSKGVSTGVAKLTGLPFTINAEVPNYATANMWYSNVSFANQFQAIGAINTTLVELYELTEAGAITGLNETNFADNSEVIISFTYFV